MTTRTLIRSNNTRSISPLHIKHHPQTNINFTINTIKTRRRFNRIRLHTRRHISNVRTSRNIRTMTNKRSLNRTVMTLNPMDTRPHHRHKTHLGSSPSTSTRVDLRNITNHNSATVSIHLRHQRVRPRSILSHNPPLIQRMTQAIITVQVSHRQTTIHHRPRLNQPNLHRTQNINSLTLIRTVKVTRHRRTNLHVTRRQHTLRITRRQINRHLLLSTRITHRPGRHVRHNPNPLQQLNMSRVTLLSGNAPIRRTTLSHNRRLLTSRRKSTTHQHTRVSSRLPMTLNRRIVNVTQRHNSPHLNQQRQRDRTRSLTLSHAISNHSQRTRLLRHHRACPEIRPRQRRITRRLIRRPLQKFNINRQRLNSPLNRRTHVTRRQTTSHFNQLQPILLRTNMRA